MSQAIIAIAAGGTGGHIFPALAVADALKAEGAQVFWIGTPGQMENEIVPKRGYPIETIRFSGVRGKGAYTFVMLPVALLRAFWDSLALLRRRKPSAVAVFGGYVSFPVGMMASALNIPLLLHEQNAVAGTANRWLRSLADAAFTAFPNTLPSAKIVGNPVRSDIVGLPAPELRFAKRQGRLRLLVLGGSLGAQAINDAVPRALALLSPEIRPIVKHQSGSKHIETLKQLYLDQGVEAELVPFIEDMASAYQDADVVICRAGATTVFELAAAGLPALLVPYPYAIDDHQTANARLLVDANAAWLLPQRNLSPEDLARRISSWERTSLLEMAVCARKLAKDDSASALASACIEIATMRSA